MLDKIIALLAEQLDLDPDNINEETRFTEDLGADSLDVVELMVTAESEYGVTIVEDELEGIKTVGDVVRYIETHT